MKQFSNRLYKLEPMNKKQFFLSLIYYASHIMYSEKITFKHNTLFLNNKILKT